MGHQRTLHISPWQFAVFMAHVGNPFLPCSNEGHNLIDWNLHSFLDLFQFVCLCYPFLFFPLWHRSGRRLFPLTMTNRPKMFNFFEKSLYSTANTYAFKYFLLLCLNFAPQDCSSGVLITHIACYCCASCAKAFKYMGMHYITSTVQSCTLNSNNKVP